METAELIARAIDELTCAGIEAGDKRALAYRLNHARRIAIAALAALDAAGLVIVPKVALKAFAIGSAPKEQLEDALRVIGSLQRLIVNTDGWITIGRSETAHKAMSEAQDDGWRAMGWSTYLDKWETRR